MHAPTVWVAAPVARMHVEQGALTFGHETSQCPLRACSHRPPAAPPLPQAAARAGPTPSRPRGPAVPGKEICGCFYFSCLHFATSGARPRGPAVPGKQNMRRSRQNSGWLLPALVVCVWWVQVQDRMALLCQARRIVAVRNAAALLRWSVSSAEADRGCPPAIWPLWIPCKRWGGRPNPPSCARAAGCARRAAGCAHQGA